MGAGVWPKARVPAGKAHPQCMCALTPTTRAMRKDGVRGQAPTEALLRHAGGGGDAPAAPAADGAGGAPAREAPREAAILGAAPDAFAAAQAGGRNAGLYRRFRNSRLPEIAKSIRSLEKRITEQEDKIRNPAPHLRPDCTPCHRRDLV